jgi:hypothetical protein
MTYQSLAEFMWLVVSHMKRSGATSSSFSIGVPVSTLDNCKQKLHQPKNVSGELDKPAYIARTDEVQKMRIQNKCKSIDG